MLGSPQAPEVDALNGGSDMLLPSAFLPFLLPSFHIIVDNLGRGASSLEGLVAHQPVCHVQAHHIIMLLIVPHHLALQCYLPFELICYGLGDFEGYSSTFLQDLGMLQPNGDTLSGTRVPPSPKESPQASARPLPNLTYSAFHSGSTLLCMQADSIWLKDARQQWCAGQQRNHDAPWIWSFCYH